MGLTYVNLSNPMNIGGGGGVGGGELGDESRPDQELIGTCSNFIVQEARHPPGSPHGPGSSFFLLNLRPRYQLLKLFNNK